MLNHYKTDNCLTISSLLQRGLSLPITARAKYEVNETSRGSIIQVSYKRMECANVLS